MKTAISLPDDTFRRGEALAGAQGISRSELYRRALQEYLEKHGEDAVRASLQLVYGSDGDEGMHPVLKEAQRRSLLQVEWAE